VPADLRLIRVRNLQSMDQPLQVNLLQLKKTLPVGARNSLPERINMKARWAGS